VGLLSVMTLSNMTILIFFLVKTLILNWRDKYITYRRKYERRKY
jgi:hypothetical protein